MAGLDPKPFRDLRILLDRVRHLDADPHALRHPDADDFDGTIDAREERPDLVRRPDGRGQADPLELPAGQVAQSLEANRELGPPFVGGELVDLVDHDPTDGLQMLPQPAAGEQDLERLRRRDEHVRRVAGDRGPLLRRRVSMSDGDTDPEALREEGHPAEHVAVEGPQRRDVQDARRLRLLPDQVLEERQERRLRLPDAGRGHQEDVRPRQDPGDRLDLRLREFVDPQGLDRVEDGGIEAEGLHGGRLKGSSD